MFTEYQEIVPPVMVPLGNRIRCGVCMATKCSVGMGIAFIPGFGMNKAWDKEDKKEEQVFHVWITIYILNHFCQYP
jgi:hypothetical protein